MDKGSASLFGTTLVITAAIIAGVYLLDRAQRSASSSDSTEDSGWTTLNTGNVSAETSPTRNDNIITCQHPEYGSVFTNAANCDEVDYENRLSHADSFQAVPERDRYSGTDYHSPENAAANSRSNSTMQKQQKPNLRLHGKSPPSGLNVSCKFSVGKALEIERILAASGNPRESTWRGSYCKQRCEAIQERCPVADDYFYYRYRYVCQGSDEHWPCYPEAS